MSEFHKHTINTQTHKKGLGNLPNPLIFGEPCRGRTDNLLIKSCLLVAVSRCCHSLISAKKCVCFPRLFIYMIILSLFLASCAPSHYLESGDMDHNLFVKSVSGRTSFPAKSIEIPYMRIMIVDDQNKMPCIRDYDSRYEFLGCATQNTIYVKGKQTENGRYIVSPAVLGHEVLHLIENATDVMPIHQYKTLR